MDNCEKVSHTTKAKAIAAAYAIKARGKVPARAVLYAYYCKVHKAWHLTKMSPDQYKNKKSFYDKERIKKNG